MLGAEIERLHSLTGVKWTDNPDRDVIPSWVADMDFEVAPVVKAAMQRVIDSGDTGYNFHAREQLIPAWADWQERHFGWRPPEDESRVFTATLNCLNLVMEFMTHPGDGVVVFTPIYYPFRMITEETGRRIVEVPLDGPEWQLDPDRFEAALDPDTKMVLWCNPHNPLGRMFTAEEIDGFAAVVERNDLLVVSDEIWCDLTFEDRHIPLLRQCPQLADRTVTLGSASKSFNVAGLRCAAAHIGASAVRDRFAKLANHFIAAPNTVGAEASLAAWTQGQPWLDKVKDQLRVNRDHLAARIASDIPGATMQPPEATYLAWIDLAAARLGPNPSATLLERGKIAVHDGGKFCSKTAASCIRVNFATSPKILDQLIDRMATVVQEANA